MWQNKFPAKKEIDHHSFDILVNFQEDKSFTNHIYLKIFLFKWQNICKGPLKIYNLPCGNESVSHQSPLISGVYLVFSQFWNKCLSALFVMVRKDNLFCGPLKVQKESQTIQFGQPYIYLLFKYIISFNRFQYFKTGVYKNLFVFFNAYVFKLCLNRKKIDCF